MEQLIAEVWTETLQIQNLSINDNFFDLGGTSMSLLQVYAKLKVLIDRDFSVMTMFTYPTIASLSLHLSKQEEVQPEEQVHNHHRSRGEKQRDALNKNKWLRLNRKETNYNNESY
ncbi:Plipastatin synthase subunit D [compost metagenome]